MNIYICIYVHILFILNIYINIYRKTNCAKVLDLHFAFFCFVQNSKNKIHHLVFLLISKIFATYLHLFHIN